MGFNLAGEFSRSFQSIKSDWCNKSRSNCLLYSRGPSARYSVPSWNRGMSHSTLSHLFFRDCIFQGYFLLGEDGDPDVDQFSNWKIQGNFGGEDYPDKTRKIFNEGGLFGEVSRWYQSLVALRCSKDIADGLSSSRV